MAGPSGGWGSNYFGAKSQPASASPAASGGWGSAYNGKPVAPQAAPSGGWGSAFNASSPGGGPNLGNRNPRLLGSERAAKIPDALAHWIASKADLAAHDIAAMPTGIVAIGEAGAHDFNKAVGSIPVVGKALDRPLVGKSAGSQGGYELPAVGKAVAKSAETAVSHPLRDPLQTVLTVAPALGAVARVGIAGDALRAGDVAGAAKSLASGRAAAARLGDRIVQVPKLVAPEGEGPAALTHEPLQLVASRAPATRLGQAVHDAVLQRSLDRNVSTADQSAVARYAGRRVGKATSETGRTMQRTAAVPAQMLERAGRSFDKGVSAKQGQLALFLRSANVTGDEAARYWGQQAAAGVNPADTGRLAKLAAQVHQSGLLKMGSDGNVAVDAERFPKLGATDDLVKENQASREGIIRQHGLMTDEGLRSRLALVAERMGSESARSDVTGVREGQGYVPLRTSVKRQAQTPFAKSRIPVIGKPAQRFLGKKATGEGIAKGLIPDNTTAGVARAAREALRYQSTVEHRGVVARYGSDVRRTGDDVLIADPASPWWGKLSQSDEQLLGREKSTLNTIPEQEHQGLAAAMRAKLEETIPGLRDKFATDRAQGLGTRAPEGYKWVPRQFLGELVHETTPRNAIVSKINDVNSFVTAATVYFKLSHIPQRLTTNATTSAISGALFSPQSLRAAVGMRKALSDREYAEAVAASGTHGYMALPHEGTSHIAQLASKGANFYAHRIDSPFRFLNLVHEARKEGIETPEQFRQLLAHAKNPAAKTADAAKMNQVLARANRASMMYDGLGQNEQRILARGLWFYPWTKAAFRYAGHTLMEHPAKALALGEAGKIGEQVQERRLGPLPSYEYSLTPWANGTTSNLGILTPFGTAGNVVEAVARPSTVAQFANPVYGAGLTATTGVNQYGQKTKTPIGDALSQLFAPTPEAQVLSAYMHPSKPTQIFQKTPAGAAIRMVLGPSFPRKTNRVALNRAAQREKTGK